METVTVAEARRTLADLVTRVGFSGKRVLLQRHGKPVAAVVSVEDLEKLQRFEQQFDEKRVEALAALEAASRIRAEILMERNGEYVTDTAEAIREMREERDDDILGLR